MNRRPLAEKCGNKASITYECKNRLPDKDGNPYPTHEECYMTCVKTANSNHDLTNLIPKKVILPAAGVTADGTCDHRVGILWDQFKAHAAPIIKNHCPSLDFLDVLILPGSASLLTKPSTKSSRDTFATCMISTFSQPKFIMEHPGHPLGSSLQLG